MGADPRKQTHNYISIIFFFVAQWSWAPLFQASTFLTFSLPPFQRRPPPPLPSSQVITNFPLERDVLTRERASDSYPISGWFTAKMLSELPLSWILPAGVELAPHSNLLSPPILPSRPPPLARPSPLIPPHPLTRLLLYLLPYGGSARLTSTGSLRRDPPQCGSRFVGRLRRFRCCL